MIQSAIKLASVMNRQSSCARGRDYPSGPVSRSGPARYARTISITFLFATGIGTVLSLWVMRQESVAADLDTRLDRQSGMMSRGEAETHGLPPPLPFAAPARAYLSDALYCSRAAAAAAARGVERKKLLARAAADARTATTIRPHWGEAWVVRAFVDMLDAGRFTPTSRAALSRSYGDAPLLQNAGVWRVKMGLAYWDQFTPLVQQRIVEETVWLLQVTPPETRDFLFDTARDSPAYRSIFLRWRLFQPSQ